MKNTIKIFQFLMLVLVVSLAFTSCAKHDFIDEMAITGKVGPQAIWELGSSSVTAGNEVEFRLQYYSTETEIDYSEVWYSVTEAISKKVSCPLVSTFTYSVSSEVSQLKRISEKIQEYPHSLAVWSDSLSAYVVEESFPVTGTLSSFSWKQPEKFDAQDSLNMDRYFGTGFMQHFKDSLYNLMKYADFRKMILGLGLDEILESQYGGGDFMHYTDSTFDDNSQTYVYHFNEELLPEGKEVPEKIKELYEHEIPFSKLIQTPAGYDVEYGRSYTVDAIMRVYDVRGVYGQTIAKTIEVN